MNKKPCWWYASRRISRVISTTIKPPRCSSCLDGRNSNSAQIAANYLQQIVKISAGAAGGKAKPNNSELVVRNWYNPNLDYKVVRGAVAYRHDHHHRSDDRDVVVGGP